MNETSTTVGYSGTTATTTYPGTTTHWGISPGVTISDSSNYSLSQTITNQNNMVRQVRVAVFTVKRNKENKIVSAEFTKELWVEIKNGSSVELAVAKELDKDFDPANTVIKEMYSISF
jgi:formylmethanofuran dehydrogenase subunit A